MGEGFEITMSEDVTHFFLSLLIHIDPSPTSAADHLISKSHKNSGGETTV